MGVDTEAHSMLDAADRASEYSGGEEMIPDSYEAKHRPSMPIAGSSKAAGLVVGTIALIALVSFAKAGAGTPIHGLKHQQPEPASQTPQPRLAPEESPFWDTQVHAALRQSRPGTPQTTQQPMPNQHPAPQRQPVSPTTELQHESDMAVQHPASLPVLHSQPAQQPAPQQRQPVSITTELQHESDMALQHPAPLPVLHSQPVRQHAPQQDPAAQRPPISPTNTVSQHKPDIAPALPAPVRTVLDVFMMTKVRQEIANNIMRAGDSSGWSPDNSTPGVLLKPSDRDMVWDMVEVGFNTIEDELRSQAPHVVSELKRVILKEPDEDALLELLPLLTDARVQQLGVLVVRTVRQNSGVAREVLLRKIEEALQPHFEQIRTLVKDFVPPSMTTLWTRGENWQMTLDSKHLTQMESYSPETLARTVEVVDADTKQAAIFATVLEEGKFLINTLKIYLTLSLPSSPENATQRDREIHEVTHFVTPDSSRARNVGFMGALLWPLRFGWIGIDVLRAVSNLPPQAILMAPTPAPASSADPSTLKATPKEVVPAAVPAEEVRMPSQDETMRPAFRLFRNTALQDVAMENIWRAGQATALRPDTQDEEAAARQQQLLDADDRELVRDMVTVGFSSMEGELQKQAPQDVERLEAVLLRKSEENTVLNLMLIFSDERVQQLGLLVTETVRQHPSVEREFLIGKIGQMLEPRIGEVQRLCDELISESVRKLWSKGADWGMTLDKKHIVAMENFTHTLSGSLEDVDSETKQAGIWACALEEGKILMHILHMYLPQNSSSGSEVDDITHFIAKETEHNAYTFALLWPLRFGAIGMDVLRAVSKMPSTPHTNVGEATNVSYRFVGDGRPTPGVDDFDIVGDGRPDPGEIPEVGDGRPEPGLPKEDEDLFPLVGDGRPDPWVFVGDGRPTPGLDDDDLLFDVPLVGDGRPESVLLVGDGRPPAGDDSGENEEKALRTCGGTGNGSSCIFPFEYQGARYTACTTHGIETHNGSDQDETWCATDYFPGTIIGNRWGKCHCEASTPQEAVPVQQPGAAKTCSDVGKNCQFTGCCVAEGHLCFERDNRFWGCKENCTMGVIDLADPVEEQVPWECHTKLSPELQHLDECVCDVLGCAEGDRCEWSPDREAACCSANHTIPGSPKCIGWKVTAR